MWLETNQRTMKKPMRKAKSFTGIKTLLFDGQVVGHVLSFEHFGRTDVSYRIGRIY